MTKTWLAATLVTALIMAGGAWFLYGHSRRAEAMRVDPDTILGQPNLSGFLLASGKAVFADRCSSCHGALGKGDAQMGVPDLTDREFLYGDGRPSSIEQIVLHGIRSGDSKGNNLAYMPAYARAKPYDRQPIPRLLPREIDDLVAFLRSANGGTVDLSPIDRGRKIYLGKAGCWDCHQEDGTGDSAIGAPNLVDGIWLYGRGSPSEISRSIAEGHAGVSPAFQYALDPFSARAVAIYTTTLHLKKKKQVL